MYILAKYDHMSEGVVHFDNFSSLVELKHGVSLAMENYSLEDLEVLLEGPDVYELMGIGQE